MNESKQAILFYAIIIHNHYIVLYAICSFLMHMRHTLPCVLLTILKTTIHYYVFVLVLIKCIWMFVHLNDDHINLHSFSFALMGIRSHFQRTHL